MDLKNKIYSKLKSKPMKLQDLLDSLGFTIQEKIFARLFIGSEILNNSLLYRNGLLYIIGQTYSSECLKDFNKGVKKHKAIKELIMYEKCLEIDNFKGSLVETTLINSINEILEMYSNKTKPINLVKELFFIIHSQASKTTTEVFEENCVLKFKKVIDNNNEILLKLSIDINKL